VFQRVDRKIETAHPIEYDHIEWRGCCALIHVAAYMETTFIERP
jgi:hypothetical protein